MTEATGPVGEDGDEYNRRNLTLIGIIGAALVSLLIGSLEDMRFNLAVAALLASGVLIAVVAYMPRRRGAAQALALAVDPAAFGADFEHKFSQAFRYREQQEKKTRRLALTLGATFTAAAFEVLMLQLTQWACVVAALFALVMCLYSVPLWQFERRGIGIRFRR